MTRTHLQQRFILHVQRLYLQLFIADDVTQFLHRLSLHVGAILSVILAALAPVTVFVFTNLPEYTPEVSRTRNFDMYWTALQGNSVWKLTHVCLITIAGIVAHVQLYRLVARLAPARVAARLLMAWLAANLFLGAQIGFVFRPYFVSPGLKVEFLRPNALQGNFYVVMWQAARDVCRPKPLSPPSTNKDDRHE